VIFDLGVSIYQSVYFRLYGIPLVKRSEHIIFDHQHLAYLNIFEKINCLYCSYASGIISFGREVASCTEQYWCPIKHAHKLVDVHHRYAKFLDYGNAENYQKNVEEKRRELRNEK